MSKQAEKSGNSKEKERKLKELLVKSFPVIKIKQLRPVRELFLVPTPCIIFLDGSPNDQCSERLLKRSSGIC